MEIPIELIDRLQETQVGLFLHLKPEKKCENDYEKAITEIIEHCKNTLVKKHSEYASEDAFHNFKSAALLTGQTPEQVLWGYALKHIVSISDMIFKQSKGQDFEMDKWQEKIGDLINYLAILYAMEKEN